MEQDELRKEAIRRINAKRNFLRMAGGFVILWIICIAIWALSGGSGGFWPAWVIFGTGIAMMYSGWAAYGPRKSGMSEAEIQDEMRKMGG